MNQIRTYFSKCKNKTLHKLKRRSCKKKEKKRKVQTTHLPSKNDNSNGAVVSGIIERPHQLLDRLRPKRISSLRPVDRNLGTTPSKPRTRKSTGGPYTTNPKNGERRNGGACTYLGDGFVHGLLVDDVGVGLPGLVNGGPPRRRVRRNLAVHPVVAVVEGGAAAGNLRGGGGRSQRHEVVGDAGHPPRRPRHGRCRRALPGYIRRHGSGKELSWRLVRSED